MCNILLLFFFKIMFLPQSTVNSVALSQPEDASVNDMTGAEPSLSAVVRGATMLAFAYIRLSQQGCLLRDNEASSDSGHLSGNLKQLTSLTVQHHISTGNLVTVSCKSQIF